jgi:hypothetical protein
VSRDQPSPAAADTPRWAIHIAIPTDWTPEQALAVFELFDQLRDAVASCYLDQIQTVLQEEQGNSVTAIAPDAGDAAGDEPAF